MNKLIAAFLAMTIALLLCVPITAVTNAESEADKPALTQEELLAMDKELDSDNDGATDVIELVYGSDCYKPDTDGDGVSDFVEYFITCTNVLSPDGNVDTDSDGLTNAQEGIYGTNADDKDSDNDNLNDYDEIMIHKSNPNLKDTDSDGVHDGVEVAIGLNPLKEKTDNNTTDSSRIEVFRYLANNQCDTDEGQTNASTNQASLERVIIDPEMGTYDPPSSGGFSATLHTPYGTSSVSYSMDFSWFFGDNTIYRRGLATVSSLLSAIAYDNSYLSNSYTSNAEHPVYGFFEYHNFDAYDSFDLADFHSDQHISEMFVGHRSYSYNGETKNIICVVVRGTNSSIEECQSNFDVGTTVNYASTSGWIDSSNHMGFDITARRLNIKLSEYISEKGLSGGDNVLWITGHSRGGALANILAAIRADTGNAVFAYTFASPTSTKKSTAQTSTRYRCIFNIINRDDLVPELPLEAWGVCSLR